MHILVPFYKEKDLMGLKGTFKLNDQKLELHYEWEPNHTGIDMAINPHQNVLSRKNELWKTTCFEAFVQIDGTDVYFEINLSTLGEWNIYKFQSCRTPQPPNEWEDAYLENVQFKPGQLQASFHFPLKKDQKIKVGLTAVIDFIDGRKNYYSLKHTQQNPDFHDFKTFLIERYT